MALTDLTRISTSGIATGSSLSGAILHGDAHFRGTQVGVTSALFDSSDDALEFNDNVKLKFGNSGDLEIYHQSNVSYIDDTTGNQLRIQANDLRIRKQDGGEEMITAAANGTVRLFHDGDQKLTTDQHGVKVTGILTATGFSGPLSNASGISTFYDLRVTNNLTVEGSTTTLDTVVTEVDKLEVAADNTTVGVAITQSGTGDILNLYDGSTEVFSVADGGEVTAAGNIKIQNTQPTLTFDDTNHQDFTIAAVGNALNITDANNGNRLLFNANGSNSLYGFLSVTGNFSATGTYYLSDEIQHSSDPDTKIRFPANDTFAVETGGNERFRIASDGQNTIKSGAHDKGLDILPVGNSQETRLRIQAKNSSGTEHTFSFNAKQSANRLDISGTGPICFIGSQNVGVHNSIPTSPLHVGDDTNPHATKAHLFVGPASGDGMFHLRGGSPTVFFDSSSGGNPKILTDNADLTISNGTLGNNGTERLRIASSGLIYVNRDAVGGRIDATAGDASMTFSDGNGRQTFKITTMASGQSAAHSFDANGDLNLNTTTNQYGYRLNIQDSAIIYAQTASSGGLEAKWHLDNSAQLMEFGTVTTDDLALVTNNVPRLRINSSGHVGIGTIPNDVDSIGKALNIGSSTGGAIYLQDSDAPTVKFGAISYNGATAELQIHAHHASSYIDLGTNGTPRLRITSAGKVLVGDGSAITPSRNLDVRGTGHQQILIGSTNNAGVSLMLDGHGGGDGSGGNYGTVEMGSDGNLDIRNYDPAKSIVFGTGSNTGSNDSVTINNNGYLGVGVAPNSIIQATGSNSSTGYYFKNTHTTSGFGMRVEGGGTTADRYSLAVFNAAGVERFRVNANGRVGINSATPEFEFDVMAPTDVLNTTLCVKGRGSGYSQLRLEGEGGASENYLTSTTVPLSIYVGSGGQKAKIDTGGRLLIGAGGADHYLHVKQNAETTYAKIESTHSSSTYTGINLRTPSLNFQIWNQGPSATGYSGSNSAVFWQAASTGPFAFYHGNTERLRIDTSGRIGVNNTEPSGRTGSIDISSNDGTSGKSFTDQRAASMLTLRNPSTTQHSFTQMAFINGGGTQAATLLRHRYGSSHGPLQNYVGDLCLFRRTGGAGSGANDFRESTRWCGDNAEARQIWWAAGDTDTSNTSRLGWHHLSASRDHPGTDAYTFFRLETGAASYARNGMGKYTVVWTTGHASGYGLQIGHFGYYMPHGSSTIVVNEHIIHRERWSNGSYYGWNDAPNMRIINNTASGGTNAAISFRCGGRRYSGFDMGVVVGIFIELYAPESANGDRTPRLYVAGNSDSNLSGGGFGTPVTHAYVGFQSTNPLSSGQPTNTINTGLPTSNPANAGEFYRDGTDLRVSTG